MLPLHGEGVYRLLEQSFVNCVPTKQQPDNLSHVSLHKTICSSQRFSGGVYLQKEKETKEEALARVL
jgi:hypothetical protein